MIQLDPRQLKAKSKRLLEEYDDLLKFIVESESNEIGAASNSGENEFEVMKKVFMNEGIKEGLRRFIQKLNKFASQDV